jgi:hypothetical protein
VASSKVDLPADFEVVFSGKDREDEFNILVDCRKRAERFNDMVLSYR